MTSFVTYSQLPNAGALTGSEIFSMTQSGASVGVTYGTLNTYYSSLTTTLTNKSISGATNTLTAIPNSALTNSSITIAGHSVSLGGTQALAASDLSNSTTGTGTIVLSTSPTLTTPNIGAATGVSTAVNHYIGASSTPTVAAGTGAGTSPTITIVGTDAAFKLTIVTGTSPVASGVLATVTFNSAYSVAPYPSMAESNAATAALSGNTSPFVTTTTNTLVLTAGTSALAASTTYVWQFHIVG